MFAIDRFLCQSPLTCSQDWKKCLVSIDLLMIPMSHQSCTCVPCYYCWRSSHLRVYPLTNAITASGCSGLLECQLRDHCGRSQRGRVCDREIQIFQVSLILFLWIYLSLKKRLHLKFFQKCNRGIVSYRLDIYLACLILYKY
jgi:hypothetical protein